MKTNILALALALSLTGSAFAQAATDHAAVQAHRHHDPHKAAQRMAHKLNLSTDQTAKIEPILADRQVKAAALRADTTLTDADRHKSLHELHKNTRVQMAAILTPDQMNQLKAMRKKHMHKADKPAGA